MYKSQLSSPNLLFLCSCQIKKKLITQFPEIDSNNSFSWKKNWKETFKGNVALSWNQVLNFLKGKVEQK